MGTRTRERARAEKARRRAEERPAEARGEAGERARGNERVTPRVEAWRVGETLSR